jgi:hypothetical protein
MAAKVDQYLRSVRTWEAMSRSMRRSISRLVRIRGGRGLSIDHCRNFDSRVETTVSNREAASYATLKSLAIPSRWKNLSLSIHHCTSFPFKLGLSAHTRTMNNRPVEQALGNLVPTHANDLPQELLSLALNLVAQSRSFSSSLKPEEEIARPYACAEIACRRYATLERFTPQSLFNWY